jgi:hypothetical protein
VSRKARTNERGLIVGRAAGGADVQTAQFRNPAQAGSFRIRSYKAG